MIFVRVLGLTKENKEFLSSRLKEKHSLESGTFIYHYKLRNE